MVHFLRQLLRVLKIYISTTIIVNKQMEHHLAMDLSLFQVPFQVHLVVFVHLYNVLLEFLNPLWLVIELYPIKEAC